MTTKYELKVLQEPDTKDLAYYASLTDWPCVWSQTFIRGTSSPGSRLLVFLLSCDGQIVAIAFGTITPRAFRTALRLSSFPRSLGTASNSLDEFWTALRQYCQNNRVQTVTISSFESKQQFETPPDLGKVEQVEARREFFVDLTPDEETILANFSSNHRRNIRKAQKQDLECRKTTDIKDFDAHVGAFEHTKSRRESRDEGVIGLNQGFCEKLLKSGEAFLIQIRDQDEILSSFLVIETPKSAFYFSGGTTERGMKMGASQLLMWNLIKDLKFRGIETLTLGGAPDGGTEGLNRYKQGFGAFEVNASNYQILTGSPYIAGLIGTAKKLHESIPRSLRRSSGTG